jgi:hypothetical protein
VVFSRRSAVLLVRPFKLRHTAYETIDLRFRLASSSLIKEYDPVDFGIKIDGI